MPTDPTETAAAIRRIKEELDSLRERHVKGLANATFGGMTPSEATEHDERGDKIRALIHQLARLQKAL